MEDHTGENDNTRGTAAFVDCVRLACQSGNTIGMTSCASVCRILRKKVLRPLRRDVKEGKPLQETGKGCRYFGNVIVVNLEEI